MTETQTQERVPEFALCKVTGEGSKSERVGNVVRRDGASFESYDVVDGPAAGHIIDKVRDDFVPKSGKQAPDYWLKAPNPAFDASKPADLKTNNRFVIVGGLYKAMNKAGTSIYFRGSVGPKDHPAERISYRMFRNVKKAP